MIRLIATDLDGTLLRPDLSVSHRTRRALDAARAAGLVVVPVTARQPRGVRRIAEAAGFTDWALCGNGAHGVHLTTGEVLFEEHVDVEAQSALAYALQERVPGVLFASVRQGGEVFVAQDGYARVAHFEDHKRAPAEMGRHTLDDVLARPSLKLIVRHPQYTPRELLAELEALRLERGLSGFAVTHSGAPFLEVLAGGVSKAWGLAHLCQKLELAPQNVLAFGDAPNDAEMLRWAGRGVAMANAHPEALAAADEVTLSNTQDGVAVVIERLLQGR